MENTTKNLYHDNSDTDYTNDEWNEFVDLAVSGDRSAMETLLVSIQDLIFNLSLRMLGTIPDAEDAVQEITIRIMTHLETFRKESSFTTWAFRIAVNHQKITKKVCLQRDLSALNSMDMILKTVQQTISLTRLKMLSSHC